MVVSSFQDLELAHPDREWDGGGGGEAGARLGRRGEEDPTRSYRDAHVWYDAEKKDNFTAYKLLIADVVTDKLWWPCLAA